MKIMCHGLLVNWELKFFLLRLVRNGTLQEI